MRGTSIRHPREAALAARASAPNPGSAMRAALAGALALTTRYMGIAPNWNLQLTVARGNECEERALGTRSGGPARVAALAAWALAPNSGTALLYA
ncbi:MAG: hypothetical protein KA748_10255 [Halomonas sp.]|nr:hypothetical protein [Halomonas sp.]MBP5980578.1 hypothetical protein [Halomonas sp.]